MRALDSRTGLPFASCTYESINRITAYDRAIGVSLPPPANEGFRARHALLLRQLGDLLFFRIFVFVKWRRGDSERGRESQQVCLRHEEQHRCRYVLWQLGGIAAHFEMVILRNLNALVKMGRSQVRNSAPTQLAHLTEWKSAYTSNSSDSSLSSNTSLRLRF